MANELIMEYVNDGKVIPFQFGLSLFSQFAQFVVGLGIHFEWEWYSIHGEWPVFHSFNPICHGEPNCY